MRDPGLRKERATAAGAVFETVHPRRSTLHDHRHAASFVTLVLDGAYTELCGGIPEVCPAGAVVLHAAGERHADHFTTAARCLNVEVPGSMPSRHTIVAADSALRRVVTQIVRLFDCDDTVPDELEGAVVQLQTLIRREPGLPRSDPPRWLNAAIERFAWTEATPLREAAGLAGVHQTHFSRAFHQHLGLTPNAYRRRARVRLASDLLLGSTTSLARIALRCGFADQSHFTRAFHDATGLAPAAYRVAFAR